MREKLSMDFAWRFHLDDLNRPVPNNMMYYYLHTKAERGRGPAATSWYDLDWQQVDLPHDYAIAGGVDFSASDTEGFVPRQNGWYRRLFRLEPEDEGRRIVLQFDGVVTHCTVWVNGHLLYRNFCGYTSFQFDITEFVDYGDMLNEITVYVDTRNFEGWWYEGAGIYRHVWLLKTAPVCVDTWGTWVRTRQETERLWTVDVDTEIRSILYEAQPVEVVQEIRSASGEPIAAQREVVEAKPRDVVKSKLTLTAENPELWSVDEPNLYTLHTTLVQNGMEIDSYDTVFGFRTLEFTVDGMRLNGKPVKLKGVCAHEDHANLGVAVPDDVREYRMRQLKFMGCNAYRCSHNPPTPEVLDLCDRLGILVMDENRWFGCAEEDLKQLTQMLRRDRNHPCIIMWSMANEERIQGTERGKRIMRAMRFTARQLDETRPVMMAMDGGCMDDGGAAGASDIIGINYQTDLFDEIHAKFPHVPLVSSEIGGKMLKYGIMGDGSGEDWKAVNTRPYFMGMFKWVAFGYRGESRGWPRIYSRSGIIEPTGAPKENTWFYKQMWDEQERFVKLWPVHWNWNGKEGEPIVVRAYANADEVELLQDGRSLGRKRVDPYARTTWTVIYQPGALEAVAYRNGQETARDCICSTGRPAAMTLQANRETVQANRTDVWIVTAGMVDSQGRPVLWDEPEASFRVDGPAVLLAVSNDDPYDTLGAVEPKRKLYHGACQLILRAATEAGEVRVTAEAPGLKPAELHLYSTPCARPPHVDQETDTDALYYFAKMDGPH